jgi:hypothetical protein
LGVLEKLDGLVSELQTRHLGHFDTRELNTLRALLRVTEQAS